MNSSRRNKAFTLIELLVVIAIIAILAAILFPVFAQAKREAKGAVAISDAKQFGLAVLMYMNDADDMFPPVVEYDPSDWAAFTWSYKCQPYIKNWNILLDPTGPTPTLNDANDENSGYDLPIYGLWGMGPRQIATNGSLSNYTFGTSATGKLMTGGKVWLYDGIGGAVNNSAGDIWSAYGYNTGATPSLTSSNVAAPADQVLLAQSGTWDFMWQQDNADSFDLYWSECVFNTYGCNLVTTAPVARKRDSDGPSVGFYPWSMSGFTTPTQEPTGITVWTGTDGHSKATPWRELMGTTIPVNNATQIAIKAFWPQGS